MPIQRKLLKALTVLTLSGLVGVVGAFSCLNAYASKASRAPYKRDYDTEKNVYELLEQADALIDANKFIEAKDVLLRAATFDPNSNSGHTHSRLSHVYQHFGNLEKSVVEAVVALKFDPEIHNLALEVAMNYKEMGKPDEAIAWAQKFIEMKPEKIWRKKAEDLIEDIQKQRELEAKYDSHQVDYLGQFADQGEVHPWSTRHLPIRVFIASGDGVAGYQAVFRQHAIDALNSWVIASNGKVAYELVDKPEDAYLTIDWTNDALKPGEKSKFMETAGITHFPEISHEENWQILKSSIAIKTINSANHKPFDDDEVKATLLHEIGHSLGLTGHSTNVNDIMYYSDTSRRLSALTKRDKATIQRMYANYQPLVDVAALVRVHALGGAAEPLTQSDPLHGSPPPYTQSGYAQPNYAQSNYQQQSSVPPSYVPPSYGQQGFAQQGYAPPNYVPPKYGQQGYAPPNYMPPNYGQQGYAQPNYVPTNYGQQGYTPPPYVPPSYTSPSYAPPDYAQQGYASPNTVPPGANQPGSLPPN